MIVLTEYSSQIVGGSRFSPTYSYEDLIQSQCSTVTVQQDVSNYWAVRQPPTYLRYLDRSWDIHSSLSYTTMTRVKAPIRRCVSLPYLRYCGGNRSELVAISHLVQHILFISTRSGERIHQCNPHWIACKSKIL